MKTNGYVLGLDIGVTSVGIGVLEKSTGKVIFSGVRLFEEADATNNQKRRARRSGRRMKSRRRTRLDDALALLKNEGLCDGEIDPSIDPYEARLKGLTTKLAKDELSSALYQLAKLRGSSLDVVEDSDKETADDLSAKATLAENDKLIKEGNYIVQIQLKRLQENGKIRGHSNNFRTKDYVNEATQILLNQDVSDDFKKAYLSLIKRRRGFSEGPGSSVSPTPYGRWTSAGQLEPIDLIEKMRGHCSVYPNEMRAPKMSYRANLFNLLNDLNNLTINGSKKITQDQKEKVIKVIDAKGSITVKQLTKILGIPESGITGFRVNKSGKPLLTEFKGYKEIKGILNDSGIYEDHFLVDEICEILTRTKVVEQRKSALRELSSRFSDSEIDQLAQINDISGYHSLSAKALDEFNEIMLETNQNQMQILSAKAEEPERLAALKGKKYIVSDDEAVLSPVAKRAQREAIKVVNRMRELYGEFDNIVIETTRAKNSQDEKNRINEQQKFFEDKNKKAEKLLEESHSNAKLNGKLKLKLRLYEEQQGKTPYLLEPIDLRLLINDPTAYEVDHILPISISLDDSYSNKVLVSRSENQKKGNLTPLQAFEKHRFSSDITARDFIANVQHLHEANGNKYNRKMNNLLCEENLNKEETLSKFINRNLVDTSYANRVVLNTLQDYFRANEVGTVVSTVKGSATHMFRVKARIDKDRDDLTVGNAHHAIDALIIASIAVYPRMNKLLSKYQKTEMGVYDAETGEVPEEVADDKFFDPQYIELITKLLALDAKTVKFSYKIDTKPNRQIADETIYSTRTYEDGEYVIKKYKNIYDPKQVAIANDLLDESKYSKYLMYRNDKQTFDILLDTVLYYKKAYQDNAKVFDKKGNKFLKNPLAIMLEETGKKFRKYSKHGDGPEIDSIKYKDSKLGNYIDISKNYNPQNKRVILQQISPYRTDFYYSPKDGYKFVTVRYSDIRFLKEDNCYEIDPSWYQGQLKKKGIDDSFQFCFSMHHGERIQIIKDDEDPQYSPIWRYVATNNDMKNVIEVKHVEFKDSKQIMLTIGKKVTLIRKFTTDVCGNMYEVTNQQLKLKL